MLKVFQDRTVGVDGYGNCYNACIASLLEVPLRECNDILPNQPGHWHERWKVYLADKGFRNRHWFNHTDDEDFSDGIPSGYAIATVLTERTYPEGHKWAGQPIHHALLVYNGQIVHDPYPLGSTVTKVLYYETLVPLDAVEKKLHRQKRSGGICEHGYRSLCVPCNQTKGED